MTGFICIDKPEGITSFTAVNKLRRICSVKKAGHTGTLDPMATGVLPILVNRGVKASEFMLTSDKHYVATLLLGITTDTEDVFGNTLTQQEVNLSEDDFLAVLREHRDAKREEWRRYRRSLGRLKVKKDTPEEENVGDNL